MQLKYRGTSYQNRNSTVQTTTKETHGVYRGIPWYKQTLNNQQTVPVSIAKLKYRGVSYCRIQYAYQNLDYREI